MPVKVYHIASRANDPVDAFALVDHPDTAQLIAHLRTDELETAFAWTQNLTPDASWIEDTEHVLFAQPGPYPSASGARPRSTAVGDVFERTDTGERFRVTPVGFAPLPPRPAPILRFPPHPHEWRRMLAQVWDVTLAWWLIGQRPTQEPDAQVALSHYRPEDLSGWLGVDPVRAMRDETDLRIPLVIAPVRVDREARNQQRRQGKKERKEERVEWTPIDGHHRMYKALLEGRVQLPAFRLTPVEAAVIDITAAHFGARSSATRYHTCGQRLTRYTLTGGIGGQGRVSWYADPAHNLPLLTVCPHCARALTPQSMCATPPAGSSCPPDA